MEHESVPSLALAAYAEALFQNRRVVVFGDATSELVNGLIERGARLVHVYDDNPTRVQVATTQNRLPDVSYSLVGQSGVTARDGSFDFGIVENLATATDPKALIRRFRRALAARGVGLVALPNPETSPKAVAAQPSAAEKKDAETVPGYYDLYEWVSAEFDEITMLGQAPFSGYSVVEFGREPNDAFTLDTAMVPGGSEEPEWYLALVSHFPVSNEGFAVVQLPRRTNTDAELTSDAPAREVPAVLSQDQHMRELESELSWLRAELEALQASHDTRSDAKPAIPEPGGNPSAAALEKQLREREHDLKHLQAELQRMEAQLEDRSRECRRLEAELTEARKVGSELIAEIESLKNPEALQSNDSEWQERLARLAASEARCVADLIAAQWTIQELEGALHQDAASAEAEA